MLHLIDFGYFPIDVLKEADKTGSIWNVRIIASGWSLNGVYYSPEVLKTAAPLFEDVKVFAFQFNDKAFNHLPDDIVDFHKEGFSRNLSGFLTDVRFDEAEKGLVAKLHVTDDFFKMTFKNSFNHGKKDLLGFSIDARGRLMMGHAEGRQGKIAEEIKKVNSLDIVTNPAAGGELLRMVASYHGGKTMKDLIKMIRENPQILGIKESADIKDKTDAQLTEMLMSKLTESTGKTHDSKGTLTPEDLTKISEMLKAKDDSEKIMKMLESMLAKQDEDEDNDDNNDSNDDDNSDDNNDDDNNDDADNDDNSDNDDEQKDDTAKEALKKANEAIETMKKTQSDMILKEALNAENALPQFSKDRITEMFKGKIVTSDEVQKQIKSEKEYLGKFVESNSNGFNVDMSEMRITTGLEPKDRRQIAMDKMMGVEPTDEEKDAWSKVPAFHGLKEAYIEFTGDKNVQGNSGITSMKEAVSSDFPEALGTSMERRLLKEYARLDVNAAWKKFATIESVDNFKTQDRIQIGGLSDIPVVAEGGTYTEFTSPNEVKASYAATKKGKILVVTWEMIKNDDLRMVTRLVSEMGKAASRTLAKFVFDLILNYASGSINGGTIYDSKALYHNDHNNTTTNALDYDSLNAAITAIANQLQPDSNEPLNINAKYLMVPYELRSLATILLGSEKIPGTSEGTIESINPNFQALEPLIIPKGFLRADENNWYVLADSADLEYLNIGFLDGKQNPEIFLQDQPTVATVFTNDQIKYKVRHVYSGVQTDFRGYYGGLVTGLS
jgi:hypothetical protein